LPRGNCTSASARTSRRPPEVRCAEWWPDDVVSIAVLVVRRQHNPICPRFVIRSTPVPAFSTVHPTREGLATRSACRQADRRHQQIGIRYLSGRPDGGIKQVLTPRPLTRETLDHDVVGVVGDDVEPGRRARRLRADCHHDVLRVAKLQRGSQRAAGKDAGAEEDRFASLDLAEAVDVLVGVAPRPPSASRPPSPCGAFRQPPTTAGSRRRWCRWRS
jgi:hypothetical protein